MCIHLNFSSTVIGDQQIAKKCYRAYSHALNDSRRRAKIADREGVTTVEFSLVFPVTLIFFLSLISLVQLFIIRNAAENAAYFGARKGIIAGSTEGEVRAVVAEEVRLGLVSNFNATINRLGDEVTVSVTIPMRGNSWVTAGFAPQVVAITQSCTLKKQER